MRGSPLRVVCLKPSKYRPNGAVERFRWGFMPNATLPYLRSLTPARIGDTPVELHAIDEYVERDLAYLRLLHAEAGVTTLVALVGVQSHQLHRALDLAAYARHHGVRACVVGGPHPMTCDTTEIQGRGIAFALAEAELVWPAILADALEGELRPVYGADQRWETELTSPPLTPPSARELRRHVIPMLGVYPARGCPFTCTFCSVIKIAGRRVRAEPVETTLASLRAAKAAGVKLVMFTSDNFNKYALAPALLRAMIEERIDLPFFVQCDTQIARQEDLVALLHEAGCWQMFLGVESFDRDVLRDAKKRQNLPERYADIVALCHRHGIAAHFSNILGFPGETEAGVLEHLRTLRRVDPDAASFYILTPIPGTEQYDDFLRDGLITETNLDRFDTTCETWRHAHLAPGKRVELLYRGYREFYGLRDMCRKGAGWYRREGTIPPFGASGWVGSWMFHRLGGSLGFHPMSGGVLRVTRDRAGDYLPLRKARFGCERVTLPKSLPPPPRDEALGRAVDVPA